MSESNMLQISEEGIIAKLSEEQIGSFTEKWSLAVFYETVAEVNELDVNQKDMFDCRKIMIAKNILEIWESQFIQKHGAAHVYELYIYLANSGPKTDSSLKENEVRILDGFVFANDEQNK